MQFDKEEYKKYVKKRAPASPVFKNTARAYVVGGGICAVGELLYFLFSETLSIPEKESGTLVSVTLIFLAALLTGLGVFDNVAKFAGAGTLVPITGFSNAVASPAIDTKSEGFVLGVGANMFKIAGPVIVYGVSAATLYGVIYWIATLF